MILKKYITVLLPIVAFSGSLHAAEIRISGGAAPMNNIYKPIKEKFEEKTKIKLILTEQSPEKALAGLDKGQFDVASAGLDWNDWLALCKEKGINIDTKKLYRQSAVSKDTVIVLVNKENNISKLNQDQLTKIFTGQIKNWKEVGGENAPIEVVFTDAIAGTNKFFAKTVFPGKSYRSDLMKVTGNVDEVAQKIAEGKNRIGFGPISMLSKDYNIKKVDTMEITRPVLFVFLEGNENVIKLRQFILSPEGEALIKR